MQKRAIVVVQFALPIIMLACASSPGPSVLQDSGPGDGASVESPAACGLFELSAGGLFKSGLLRGHAWTSVSPGTTISPATFDKLAAGDALCVQGSVNPWTEGYAWASLGIDVNGVFRTTAARDAGIDSGTSSGQAGAYVPMSDGLILNIRKAKHSPVWLCLTGANGKRWCNMQPGGGSLLRWNSFVEITGTEEIYANEPLIGIDLTVPDPEGSGSSSTAFDFCLDSIVEAASFCQCPGGVCACSAGMATCGGACVQDISVNPDNCGACGHVCASTSACGEGQCVDSLFLNLRNPHSVVADSDSLYFTDTSAGMVVKAPLSGGTPVALATGQTNPGFMAIDAVNVYWTNQGTEASDWADGSIMKVAINGGTPVALASAQSNLAGIVVDTGNVYWASTGTKKNHFADGAILSVPLSGGAAVALASKQVGPYGITVDGANIYWINVGTSQFCALVNDGSVMKMALGGGAATRLVTAQAAPLAIAVDSTSVYWATPGTVSKVPLGGGTPTVLARFQSQPTQIVVSSVSVYWTNYFGGSVVKVPLNGGAPVTLAKGQNHALGIALGPTDVFWTSDDGAGSGGILRIPR